MKTLIIAAVILAGISTVTEARPRHRFDANSNVTIIPNPSGCPPRAFCGCGLRKYLGIADASLNLAWNWVRKFPRTHARIGAAAVWRHHVAYIEGGSPGNWLLRDYNSGGHRSRLHHRSVAGAVFVDPHSRLALR